MKTNSICALLLGTFILGVGTTQVLAQEEFAQNEMDDTSSVTMKADPNATVAETGDAADTDEAPPRTQEHFSVTTWKIQKKKAPENKSIQLLLPAHNSKFTPGVVTFSWKVAPPLKKKKVMFVLEKVDTKKQAKQFWKGEKLSIDLKSGKYRWQIVSNSPKAESHWRYFSVIDMKSKSLDALYDGPAPGKKKTTHAKAAPREEPSEPSGFTAYRGKEPQIDNPVSEADLAAVNPIKGQNVYDVDEAAKDEKLKEWKEEKLKAEQQAKDLENQLEVAKQEHLNAVKAAKEQAARLKAERLAKAKAQMIAAERAAKAEAERLAKEKAERIAKAKYAKMRAAQMEQLRAAKLKTEKAMKKLQARIEAEKRAKLEAENATRELAAKVEAERQANLKIQQKLQSDLEEGDSQEPVAAKPARNGTRPAKPITDDGSAMQFNDSDNQANGPVSVPTKKVVQSPPADAGPPMEPPSLPAVDTPQSAPVSRPVARPRQPPAVRVPAQQPRGPASVAPSEAPASSKKSDADSLQW